MKRINKKGFTLVELLAVIVVLAILILLAIPAVTAMMNKAKSNAFRVEVENTIKVTKNWYSASQLEGDVEDPACISIKQLITDGYMDKKKDGNSEGLDGGICIGKDGKVYYSISNKDYKFEDMGTNADIKPVANSSSTYSALSTCSNGVEINTNKTAISCKGE